MGKYRTRELTQRVRYALLAGVAGAFLIPQVAAAAPTGGEVVFGGATIPPTSSDMNITSSNPNNVITWRDYSIAQGERVRYDNGAKTNNYLNIVTGANTSNINGTIEGGKDVYIVNPNGVIFGKTASVNVGNLYVSTQEESTLNMTAFTGSGASPLSTTVTDVGKADVVNMGSITANKVEVYGRSIRILDAANVHAATSPVILHIDEATNGGYAHIGYQSGHVPSTSDYEIHKKVTPTTPPSSPPTTVVAAATAADNYYQLVSTPTEFQNINSDLTQNYMLANDIDFTDSATNAAGEITPIGGNTISTASGTITYAAYSGKFDGNFFRVQNYKVTNPALERAGLFGELNHAQIYNLGVTGATVTGDTSRGTSRAGGVAGYSYGDTSFLNVYIKNSTINGLDGYHGGLIGYTTNTTLDSVYSKATIGAGGGIIGYSSSGTTVTNAYSDVKQLPNTSGAYFIYYVLPSSGTTVTNAYSTGLFSYSNSTPNVTNTFIADKDTGKIRGKDDPIANAIDGYASKNYAAWGNAINNTGAPGAKWRIYEGRTLPLLTAFMDGTATATYDTRYFNANVTLNTESANTPKSNNGADITTGLTYNSQYVKIVGKASGADVVGGKSNVVTYAGAMQYNADGTPNLDHIYDYVSAGTNDFDKTNGIRNAGTKAILWSDQDGPNLRGVNVTIGKRKVDMTVAGDFTAERQYNGKLDVKDAFIEKVLGGISTDGFTREDSDPNHPTVSLNTTGFTATMVDKHVGTGKVANFGGSIGLSGEDKDNYDFDGNLAGKTGKVNITKAPLLLSFRKKKADDRVYDGTSVVRDDAMKQSVSPGNISINKTIAAGSRGEVMTDETGTADVLALADITDPKYTDTAGNEQIHQGAHKLKYTNVKLRTDGIYSSGQDYALYYTPEDNHEVAVTNDTVYLDGSIIRRQIKTGDFKVYHKTDNSAADATKVYDGTVTYDLNDPRYSDIYLSSNVGATDDNTGVVARDQGHITFLLQNGTTATFMTDELTPSETKNVKTAKKIAYKVHADADTDTDGYGGHLLDDYWVVNDKDTALTESTNFNATGKGTITPKALTATVVKNHITKVYDGWTKQTDGNRTLTPGKDLVTISGYVAGDSPRTNTSTADYASPNVVWDATNQTEKAQNVTYHVSFDRGTGDESENYILDANATGDARYGIELTQDSAGKNYTGTIKRRPITINMGTVDKIYDGTAVNTKSNITGLAGKTAGDTIAATVLADDGITAATLKAQHAAMLSAGTAHSSFGRVTGSSFAENVNASNGPEHDVRYQNVGNVLQEALAAAKKHNYTIDDTIYGKGTITRRRINPDGFQVLRKQSDGTYQAERITKTYDGTSTYTLPDEAYLRTPTVTPTPSDKTGIIEADKDKIRFRLATNTHGTFQKTDGTETTHVSEAKKVAYQVVAYGVEGATETDEPLKNYTFGTATEETAHTLKNLENLKEGKTPAAVLADGSITPAKIVAETVKNLNKTYDGVTGYTKGDRDTTAASVTGENVIKFKLLNQDGSLTDGLINDASGMPVNSSTAAYVDKNVLYNTQKEPVAKAMNYTAKLTGTYADDYEIVDANHPNTKLSTMTESGGTKNVSTVFNNVADAGTISPRQLKIDMDKDTATKTYDGTAENKKAKVNAITSENITSPVLRQILNDDGISENALTNKYVEKLIATTPTATSTFGRRSKTPFADVNASNGTDHDVRYQNMKDAFDEAFASGAGKEKIAGNYTFDNTVYGKGTINRKAITPNTFKVSGGKATKVYDGTSAYTVPAGSTLTANMGELVGTDASKIQFAISGNGAKFMKTDGVTETANVADARKVAYNITVSGDSDTIRNYTLNGQNLESGNLTASGGGSITRRVLELKLDKTKDIDKVYDGETTLYNTSTNHWNALKDTDSAGNVMYVGGTTAADKLVASDGTSFNITSNYMKSGSADKNVKHSGSDIVDKDILYKVAINGNATNYSFKKGGTVTNAELGLELSATGKITPKDLSGAFKKVTKTYDGTTSVPAGAVGFEIGANGVLSDDAGKVNLKAGYGAVFESPNVKGSESSRVIGGETQHNWVNYTNVELDGTDAGNYKITPDANGRLYGLGEITPLKIDSNTVINYGTVTQATKTYDGTQTVKRLVSGVESADKGAVKGYIEKAEVQVGTERVNLYGRMSVTSAMYDDTKDVNNGTAQGVTYKLTYTPEDDGNIVLEPNAVLKAHGTGIITKRDVNVTVNSSLTKTYDATENVTAGTVKNAAGETVSDLNDNLTLDGIVAGDGTTYTTTAEYGKKNASDIAKNTGTDKRINYTLTLTSNAGNYNLKYNGVDNSSQFHTEDNIITKRKVDVQFKNPPARTYNGSAENTAINPFVSSADDAAVLRKDKPTLISGTDVQNLAGISSKYVQNDRVTEDPNAGKDKLVRFDNVRTAMNNALGSDASNYEFNETAYAKGTINKANIDTSKITFRTSGATKTYDGTDRVKYNGSSASDAVKNYITEATAHLDGGNTVDLRGDLKIDEKATRYESSNAGTGIGVKYKFRLNNSNIEISGKNEFEMPDTGEIKRRVLNLDLTQKTGIDKIYDATDKVYNTDNRHYDAFADNDAKGNVTYAASTTAENKIVRKDGNPETTVKVTAKYADENAGAKNVNYTAQIEGDAGKNYTLKYGTTEGDAETGINFAATGTIAKRKLTLGFDKASKQYDTLADNPDQKKLLSAIADNSDARGVDTLKQDGILAADGTVNTGAFDTTHVASEYGIRSNDPANPFTPDPNVGTKDVRYTNVKSALSGTKAGNYDIEDTVYGTGEITRAKIKAADFDFQIDPSKKTYDGTTTVYWKDKEGQWQEAKGEEGLDGAKKYYFGDRSTVKLANGQRVKVNPADFSLTEAAYQNKNVAGGTETWTDADGNTNRNWVNYKLHINTTNFDVEGERDTTRKGVGTISKRNLATMLPKHLIKEYDGQQTFDETNRDYVNALANENITHIVKADQSKVQLKVKGEYDDPNASAETKVDAQKGIHLPAAPNGRKVKYTLTLSGDADTLANYTLDGHDTTYTVPGKPADIYKKTLTVTVKNIDKVYDGTSTVVRDAGGGILVPHPEAGKLEFDPDDFVRGEEFSFDQTAADKIDGDYSDPNVNPNGDGTKSITYRKLSQAFADNATRGTAARYAKNYRVEDTAQGRGKITPRKVSAADFALSFSNAVKTYDNRDTVKPNKGMRSLNDLLNDNATVKIGTGAVPVAKKELDVLSGTYGGTDAGTYDNVTYTLRYTGHNLNVTDALTQDKQKGEIIKRAVTVDVLGSLWKYYDGTEKLYQTGDRSIKTYRGSMEVKEGDDIVYMSRANGADDETGLLSDDGSTNVSTAHFVGKDAGDDKNVAYTFAIGGANAKNYQLVNIYNEPQTAADTKGGNTIRKRPLDIVFKDVRKEYDTTDVNRSATPYVNDADATVLQRDGAGVRPILDSADQQKYKDRKELRLIDRRSGKALSVASAYEPSMDAPHIPAANAGDKSVRYSGVGSALRSILGTDADKNYDLSPLDENLYGNGRIDKARISASDFRLKFTPANKEYDGGYTISDARSYLHPDSKMRLPHTPVPPDQEWTKYRLTDTDVERMTGTYRAVGGKRPQDVGRKPVDYEVKLKDDNFIFGEWKGTDFTEGKWDGVIRASEWGDITPREIFEDSRSPLTKVYDGTRNIANVGDDLLTFRHKSGERPFIKNDDVRNSSTATYDNANVAWKNNVWNQGNGSVGDVNVTYRLKLMGRDAENYKIVSAPGRTVKDSVDQDGTRTQTTDGTGKITPRDIHLKADPQTRWINEGLPDSYSGTPMGSNLGRKDVPELVPGEVLPGQIEYSSPNARLLWDNYAINGTYRAPKAGTRYQLPDGTWTTQSFVGGDGDAVSRNYRFVQDTANKSAFHMGPYVPDYEYYKAMTQVSKMTPDEYAYENASLDRRRSFGRDPEAEIAYTPPSINTIKDGVDITQTGIHVTDETVFSLVNEVFGGK